MVQVAGVVTEALNVTAAGALMVTSNGLTQAATEEPTGRTITLYKLPAKLFTVTGEVNKAALQLAPLLVEYSYPFVMSKLLAVMVNSPLVNPLQVTFFCPVI